MLSFKFVSLSLFIAARPKRLFILVNPFGGRKHAVKIFNKDIKPLLVAADIQFTLQGEGIVHSRWSVYFFGAYVYDLMEKFLVCPRNSISASCKLYCPFFGSIRIRWNCLCEWRWCSC